MTLVANAPGSDLGSGRFSRHHPLWRHCFKGIATKRDALFMKEDSHTSVCKRVECEYDPAVMLLYVLCIDRIDTAGPALVSCILAV